MITVTNKPTFDKATWAFRLIVLCLLISMIDNLNWLHLLEDQTSKMLQNIF